MDDEEVVGADTLDANPMSSGLGNAMMLRKYQNKLRTTSPVPTGIGTATMVRTTDEPKSNRLDGIGGFIKDWAVATGQELKGMVDPSNEDTFAPSRIVRGFASAAYNTVEGLGRAMSALPSAIVRNNLDTWGIERTPEIDYMLDNNIMVSIGDSLASYAGEKAAEIEIKNPKAFDKYVSAMGFIATTWIPGAGAVKLAKGLKMAKAVAAFSGAAVSTVIDSMLESGFVHKECLELGMSKEAADNKALLTFGLNVPLNMVTDYFGGRFIPQNIFNKGANLKMSAVEAVQEGTQKVISETVMNEELSWDGVGEEAFYAGLASLTLGQMVRFVGHKQIKQKAQELSQHTLDTAIMNIQANEKMTPLEKKRAIQSIKRNRNKFVDKIVDAVKKQQDLKTETKVNAPDKVKTEVKNEAPDATDLLQLGLEGRVTALEKEMKNVEDELKEFDKAEQRIEKDIEKDMTEYDKVNKPVEPKAVEPSKYANETDYINDTADLLGTIDFGLDVKEREALAKSIWSALDNEQAVNNLYPKYIPEGRASNYADKRRALMSLAVNMNKANENIAEGKKQWSDIKKAESDYAKQKELYDSMLTKFNERREAHLAKITKQAFSKFESDKGKAEKSLMELVMQMNDVYTDTELAGFEDLVGEIEKGLSPKDIQVKYNKMKRFFDKVSKEHIKFAKARLKQADAETAFVQKYLNDLVRKMGLSEASKAKFSSAVLNVRTLDKLQQVLPAFRQKLVDKLNQDLTNKIVATIVKKYKTEQGAEAQSKNTYEHNEAYQSVHNAVKMLVTPKNERVDTLRRAIEKLGLALNAMEDQNSDEAVAIKKELVKQADKLKATFEMKDIPERMAELELKAYSDEGITVFEALEHAALRLVQMKNRPLGQSNPVEAYSVFKEISEYFSTQKLKAQEESEMRQAELLRKIAVIYKDITGLDITDPTQPYHVKELSEADMTTKAAGFMSNQVNFFTLLDMLSLRSDSMQEESNIYKICTVADNIIQEKTGKITRLKEIENTYREVFGLKSEKQMMRKIEEDSKEVKLGKFTDARGRGIDLIYSISEARQFFAEMKNSDIRDFYTDNEKGMGYTPEMIEAIEGLLSTKDKLWVEKRLEFYKKYRAEVIDPVHKADFKIGMGFIENYVPVEREGFDMNPVYVAFNDMLDEHKMRASLNPSYFKERGASVLPLRKMSDIAKDTAYVARMEHYMAFKMKMKELRHIFEDPKIMSAIKAVFGKKMATNLKQHLDDISRGHKQITDANNWISYFRNNFVVSKLALKAKGFVTQLISNVVFAEKVNPVTFAKNSIKFFDPRHVKDNIKLMTNLVNIKSRGLDITKELHEAMQSKEYEAFEKKPSWLNTIMLNVRLGDVGSAVWGGWAKVQTLKDKGMSEAEALDIVSKDISLLLASGDIAYQNNIQKSGLLGEIITMFRSPDSAFFQRIFLSSLNVLNNRTSGAQFAKVAAIYGVIVPTLYTLIQNMFRWDDEDQVRAIAMSPFRGWFFMEDFVTAMLFLTQGTGHSPRFFLETMYLEAGRAMKAIQNIMESDSIDGEDLHIVLAHLASFTAMVSNRAAPLPAIVNAAVGLKKIVQENDWAGLYLLGGFTQYQLDQREEALDEGTYIGIENMVESFSNALEMGEDILDDIL